jgi:tRNA-splicing ligase RtcB
MLGIFKKILQHLFVDIKFDDAISCHHNYIDTEVIDDVELIVTRKGAIRAGAGQLGLIPGSMGTGSYVVRGLGNADSMYSASHGAGRKMSRAKAKKTFTQDDLIAQTEGVNCRKDQGVVDEIPGAYKDINEVIKRQESLVEPLHFLRQILCVKG